MSSLGWCDGASDVGDSDVDVCAVAAVVDDGGCCAVGAPCCAGDSGSAPRLRFARAGIAAPVGVATTTETLAELGTKFVGEGPACVLVVVLVMGVEVKVIGGGGGARLDACAGCCWGGAAGAG